MGGVTGCGPRDGARHLALFPTFLPPVATGGRDRRQLFLFLKKRILYLFHFKQRKQE